MKMNLNGFFLQYCQRLGVPYNEEAVNYLIETQYKSGKQEMRCCHPRDIVDQIINSMHIPTNRTSPYRENI